MSDFVYAFNLIAPSRAAKLTVSEHSIELAVGASQTVFVRSEIKQIRLWKLRDRHIAELTFKRRYKKILVLENTSSGNDFCCLLSRLMEPNNRPRVRLGHMPHKILYFCMPIFGALGLLTVLAAITGFNPVNQHIPALLWAALVALSLALLVGGKLLRKLMPWDYSPSVLQALAVESNS